MKIVIEIPKEAKDKIDENLNACDLDVYDCVMIATKNGTVLPMRKIGRWIMHIDDLFPLESTMECSECGEHQPITIDDNFCPNCGAKME